MESYNLDDKFLLVLENLLVAPLGCTLDLPDKLNDGELAGWSQRN